MGRKSSIRRLPDDVRVYIETHLADGRLTLDELIADLREKFPAADAAGDLPSRSAIHRYGQKLDRRLAAIRASTEAARILTDAAADDQDSRSEAVIALVQTEMFDSIMDLQSASEDDIPTADRIDLLSKAAKNIATLARASVNQKRFRLEIQAKTEAAAANVEKIAKRGGLSADAVQQLRSEILGIAK